MLHHCYFPALKIPCSPTQEQRYNCSSRQSMTLSSYPKPEHAALLRLPPSSALTHCAMDSFVFAWPSSSLHPQPSPNHDCHRDWPVTEQNKLIKLPSLQVATVFFKLFLSRVCDGMFSFLQPPPLTHIDVLSMTQSMLTSLT